MVCITDIIINKYESTQWTVPRSGDCEIWHVITSVETIPTFSHFITSFISSQLSRSVCL